MTKTISWELIAAVAVIALVAGTVGCSGGSSVGGDDPAVDTGSVSGQVLYFDNDQGLQNIQVTVAGQTAMTDENGNFTVTNVPAGTDREVVLTLPDWLVMPTNEPILVDVAADQTTNVKKIYLIGAEDRPPDPLE